MADTKYPRGLVVVEDERRWRFDEDLLRCVALSLLLSVEVVLLGPNDRDICCWEGMDRDEGDVEVGGGAVCCSCVVVVLLVVVVVLLVVVVAGLVETESDLGEVCVLDCPGKIEARRLESENEEVEEPDGLPLVEA